MNTQALRVILFTTIGVLLFGGAPCARAGSLGTTCDKLEQLANENVLHAIQASENILTNEKGLITGEPDLGVQSRFYRLCAFLCNREARDPTLNAEQKRFYYAKECERWIDYFAWFTGLPKEKKDAWIGKINWNDLTSHQSDIVAAAQYLGAAACKAVEKPHPPSQVLENTVTMYERIEDKWLNPDAIDYWGRVFHPPDQLLNAPVAAITELIKTGSWKLHWEAYERVVGRRANGPFKDAIKKRFKKISAGLKAKKIQS